MDGLRTAPGRDVGQLWAIPGPSNQVPRLHVNVANLAIHGPFHARSLPVTAISGDPRNS